MTNELTGYLSHRRVSGKLSKFGGSLCAWGVQHDVQLKVDSKHAEAFRPIDEFIDALVSSSGVVFLLNTGFFESPWCISELCGHYKNYGAHNHSVYVAVDGWIKEPVNEFFESEEKRVVDYWQNRGLDKTQRELVNLLPEIFDDLKMINYSFDEKILQENEGQPLWEYLQKLRNRNMLDFSVPDVSDLDEQVRSLIEHELSACPPMVSAMGTDSAIAATNQLYTESKQQDGLAYVHRMAQIALRHKSGKKRESIIACVDQIALLMCHYLLDNEACRSRLTEKPRQVVDDILEVRETSALSVHLIAHASNSKMNPTGGIEDKSSVLSVPEQQALQRSKIVKAGLYSNNGSFKSITRSIWKVILPHVPLAEDETLSDEQLGTLNRSLKRKFDVGRVVYFAVPAKEPEHPLHKVAVSRMLKFHLPYLVIIKTGVTRSHSLLKGGLTEIDMEDYLRLFCEFKS